MFLHLMDIISCGNKMKIVVWENDYLYLLTVPEMGEIIRFRNLLNREHYADIIFLFERQSY